MPVFRLLSMFMNSAPAPFATRKNTHLKRQKINPVKEYYDFYYICQHSTVQ